MSPDPGSSSPEALLSAARTLAADLLEPGAAAVDATVVPRSHLDALGRAGLLGLAVPVEAGGPGVPAKAQRAIQRVLAGADLATWFVSAQHHGPVRLVADSDAPVRTDLLPAMVSGRRLAGTAFAHLRRWPDRPVRAERAPDGWRFSWDRSLVHRLGSQRRVHPRRCHRRRRGGLRARRRPASNPDSTASDPLRMAAMTATRTVRLTLDGLIVPDSHVLLRQPIEEWLHVDRRQTVNSEPGSVRSDRGRAASPDRSGAPRRGSTPGVVAAERLGERLDRTYAAAERLLDDVPPDDAHDERLAVRAEAQRLMIDVTTALVVAGGGRSMTATIPPSGMPGRRRSCSSRHRPGRHARSCLSGGRGSGRR